MRSPLRWGIYGATGETGSRLARLAVRRGHRPLLLGRDPGRLAEIAAPLGLSWAALPLSDRGRLVARLRSLDLVVNAAGPTRHTFAPLLRSSLAARIHYLDLGNELVLFEALRANHWAASRNARVLVGGAGFLTAATELLAVDALRRLPTASHLEIGISRPREVSPGTVRTVWAAASGTTQVRRRWLWERPPLGQVTSRFDFGEGPRLAVAVPFGDLLNVAESAPVANLRVCVEASPLEWLGLQLVHSPRSEALDPWIGRAWWWNHRLSRAFSPPRERRQTLIARARGARDSVATSLRVGNPHTLSCRIVLELVEVLGSQPSRGWTTPGILLGGRRLARHFRIRRGPIRRGPTAPSATTRRSQR